MILRCTLLTLLLAAVLPVPAEGASFPPLRAQTGMVAADSELASQAGVDILRAGGNAADAAVTTALVLGVVHPFASGIGGGGFTLYYDRESDAVLVIDFRETAPAAASRDMFVVDGQVQPQMSLWTGRAVGVPGEVAGLFALHERFGHLPWADVVAPAIRLAEEGFVVDYTLAARLEDYRDRLVERPELMARFVGASGELVREGERLHRPHLAATLRAIAEDGPDAFYRGPVAEQIVAAVQAADGVMSVDDLAGYAPVERSPLVGHYRGLTLYTMPPPSSGGTTLLAALNVLEGFDLGSMGANASASLHLIAEALQFAFADRATYLGDADFVEVPVEALISPSLGEARQSLFRPEATLPPEAYGMAASAPPDDGGTSHFSIVDAERNVIALTTTINTGFGSGLVAGQTGIILNNEMDDFSAQPGAPNIYGLVGNEANAVAPGKRPLSSMSPTLVFRDGRPYLTLGASGGPAIITATLQTLTDIVDFHMTVREAIEAPRIHHQWQPPILFVETGIPADVRVNLAARGHTLASPPFGASVQAIVIDGDDLYGASDPRKAGQPAGY